eukprot:scaffold650888_cov36-Prasinocladus_malaysianus.AAC.1
MKVEVAKQYCARNASVPMFRQADAQPPNRLWTLAVIKVAHIHYLHLGFRITMEPFHSPKHISSDSLLTSWRLDQA